MWKSFNALRAKNLFGFLADLWYTDEAAGAQRGWPSRRFRMEKRRASWHDKDGERSSFRPSPGSVFTQEKKERKFHEE
jgi:hypothetical protein